VICVTAFGMLLPPAVLSVPAHGCLNVHASLLPAYRGAAPIQRAILCGDSETGVSIMRMDEGLDSGPYALQRTLSIEGMYADEVESRLAVLGAEALAEVLAKLPGGGVEWTAQNPGDVTYARRSRRTTWRWIRRCTWMKRSAVYAPRHVGTGARPPGRS